jgi:pyrroline-5-carboxylate reductase
MDEFGPLNIAIIGGGNMARGLVGGLLSRGLAPERLTVTAASEATRAALAVDFGVRVDSDNVRAIADATVVVLAVKPQILGDVARAMAPELRLRRPLVISVAAGIRVAALRAFIGEGIPLVRAMPNRPALLGAGATGLYADDAVGDSARALATQLLGAAGLALWVDEEDQLDLVTALSGSGPAYFFRLAELMAEAAVAAGLDPAVARQLAAQTLAGAGQMVAAEPAPDLPAMRAAVTSKGGTTAAALARFDELGLPATVAAAMQAAVQRSQQMAEVDGRGPA